MTAPRLSDAELRAGLRSIAPSRATAGLRDRIRSEVAVTSQQRPLPPVIAAFGDVDPRARRRALLIAATLLVAVSVSVALAVGASLNRRGPPELSLEPPADPIAFVQTAYSAMPELPPLTLTAVEDGVRKIRVYVDGSGAVRIERYASVEATEPEEYTIYSGTSMAELVRFRGATWWRKQAGAIAEDPRVFVYATIGQAGWGTGVARCATIVSDPSIDPVIAASDIQYVGSEYVLGRPTYRFRCVGDRWMDIETRLVLRSQGPATAAGAPADGAIESMEVTELVFGQPSADLFAVSAPPGVPLMSEDDYLCARDPYCLASPRPLVTPSPAGEPASVPADLEALMAEAGGAVEDLPAFEATFQRSNTKYPGSELRLHHDGAGRYRLVETREEGGGDVPTVTLIGPDGQHQSQMREDRRIVWYPLPERAADGVYPITIAQPCDGGWAYGRADVLAGRAADRVDCPGDGSSYWIDRDLRILLRSQLAADARAGADVVELVALRFAAQPASLFELPDDAVVVDQ